MVFFNNVPFGFNTKMFCTERLTYLYTSLAKLHGVLKPCLFRNIFNQFCNSQHFEKRLLIPFLTDKTQMHLQMSALNLKLQLKLNI